MSYNLCYDVSHCYDVSLCCVKFVWVTRPERPRGAKDNVKRPWKLGICHLSCSLRTGECAAGGWQRQTGRDRVNPRNKGSPGPRHILGSEVGPKQATGPPGHTK